MFIFCVYIIRPYFTLALLSGTVEAWSVPRPRVSSSDSPRVGAYGGLDGASHSWPFKYRNNRTFGESNPARITLPFDKIIREYNFGGRRIAVGRAQGAAAHGYALLRR